MTLRSALYRLARLLGDLQAFSRGPRAIIDRLARKELHKRAGAAINRWIK